MINFQTTIRQPFPLSGVGLHSGQETKLILKPARPNSGIYFVKEGKKIPVSISNVKDARRGTSLDGVAVVEHLLSALYGLGIDNLEIEIAGDELPVLDGSALPYVEAIEKAGIVEQKELKKILLVESAIKIIEGAASLEVLPYRGFKINFMVDFEGVGEQRFSFDAGKQSYKEEIAPARTFGYLKEYEHLKTEGLARGASPENALVIGKEGYLNQPRFPDEMVRHKILDLIGDLALLKRPLKAEIKAIKSGHKLNVELARRILEHG